MKQQLYVLPTPLAVNKVTLTLLANRICDESCVCRSFLGTLQCSKEILWVPIRCRSKISMHCTEGMPGRYADGRQPVALIGGMRAPGHDQVPGSDRPRKPASIQKMFGTRHSTSAHGMVCRSQSMVMPGRYIACKRGRCFL